MKDVKADGTKLLVTGTPPSQLDRELTFVGKSLNRAEALEKVTGRAKYAGDIKVPDMLYGRTLHCPYLRARIVSIDASRAEALPGVKAILTRENTKGWRTTWYRSPSSHCLNASRMQAWKWGV